MDQWIPSLESGEEEIIHRATDVFCIGRKKAKNTSFIADNEVTTPLAMYSRMSTTKS